jgi:hypothetical protein
MLVWNAVGLAPKITASRRTTFGKAVLVFGLAFGGLGTGCGESLEPYETRGGSATRLNGEEAAVGALAISEALRLSPHRPVYVRGYLLAPYDDSPRLCAQLERSGICRAPSLVLDTSAVDIDASPALESGCCSTGHWSPRPLVLQLEFSGRTVRVLG